MHAQKKFAREFSHLSHVLEHCENILIVAHTRPDPDTAGSVVALGSYIKETYNKEVTLGCFNPFPAFLSKSLGKEHVFEILDSEQIDLTSFDLAIGCDSVDRGFDAVIEHLDPDCITVIFDHHHDISLEADIVMIDPTYASVTELLYHYFIHDHGIITKKIANALLAGIIGDTGIFQHANTSSSVLTVASDLIKKGASVSSIVNASFANQKIETLNLWGSALEKAQYHPESGLVTTALTREELHGRKPSSEEVKEVASILVNAPSVRAALIVFQIDHGQIKASLRAKKDALVDVSEIAHFFGGGGHPLAAGFEMTGTIRNLPQGGWYVE